MKTWCQNRRKWPDGEKRRSPARKGRGTRARVLAALTVLLVAEPLLASAGARIDCLKSFGSIELSGTEPLTTLLEGSDGMLYGTTSKGGPSNAPTMFRITKAGTDYKVIVALPGATSISSLTEGADGQLYGTVPVTFGTNAADTTYGTVFKVAKTGSAFTALHTFFRETAGIEGSSPRAGVLALADRMLYGTAASGGISNYGTIFKLENDGSGFEVLYHFKGTGAGDGASPRGALIQASDGRLYGTTDSGGTGGYGTVFRINPDGTEYGVLCHFSYGTGLPTRPQSALLEGPDGALYGTAGGVVFKLNKDGSGLTGLLSGITPVGIAAGIDGRLYGTSDGGGVTNRGTIFSMRSDGTDLQTLHSFLRLDWSYLASPIQGRDGVLYAVDRYGGTAETGELFRINTDGTGFATLHNFSACGGDGRNPCAELIQCSDGDFYGTTGYGGLYERGTVFRVNRQGASTVLYHFGANADDGSAPGAALLEGSDGALYGTTSAGGGGYYYSGTVFKLNKDGSGYAVLHRFLGSPSVQWEPAAALIEGHDGLLYGTTTYGGTTNLGTVFRLAKNGSGFCILHSFLGSANGDGREPRGHLIQSTDGILYGCTYRGSSTPISPSNPGYGTIYKVTTNGSDYLVLHSFDFAAGDAAWPTSLIEGSDGGLYGITYPLAIAGGTSNTNIEGVVFTVKEDGSDYRILHSFFAGFGTVTNNGTMPTSLVEDATGALYGTTDAGGSNRLGAVFRLHKDGSGYDSLVSFAQAGPKGPCGLTCGSDGAFYGVTVSGGEMDSGTVFRFLPPELPQMLGVAPAPKPSVSFAGAPGIQYELLRSGDLRSWSVLATLTMPAAGVCSYEDISAPNSGAFYRARWSR